MNGEIIVVTGPARSGKSEWAEQLAAASAQQVIYVATAQENSADPEWQARIRRHQRRRPQSWATVHCPNELVTVLKHHQSNHCLLIDSLGTWVANHLDQNDMQWRNMMDTLLLALDSTRAKTIWVAEETGWGVVPAYPLGRLFRDRLGDIARSVTARADMAYLVCAGIAVNLKEIGHTVGETPLHR